MVGKADVGAAAAGAGAVAAAAAGGAVCLDLRGCCWASAGVAARPSASTISRARATPERARIDWFIGHLWKCAPGLLRKARCGEPDQTVVNFTLPNSPLGRAH